MVRRFGSGPGLPGSPLSRSSRGSVPWRKLGACLVAVVVVLQVYSWSTLGPQPEQKTASGVRREAPTSVTIKSPDLAAPPSLSNPRNDLAVSPTGTRPRAAPHDSTVLSEDEHLLKTLTSKATSASIPQATAKPRRRKISKNPKRKEPTQKAGLKRTSKTKKKPVAKVTTQKEVQPVVQFANVDKTEKLGLATPAPTETEKRVLPLPHGTYEDSCAGCVRHTLETMTCTCCLIDGKNCAWNASITLVAPGKKCARVDNNKGKLECHKGLPAGSYAASCKECTGDSKFVSCACCTGPDGVCKPTPPIEVPPDCGDVDNRRGNLVCANKTLPEGLYQNSCQNCSYTGATKMLRCACCNVYDRNKPLRLGNKVVTRCAKTRPVKVDEACNEVFNNQGQLQCRGSLPTGGYLEDCTDCTSSQILGSEALEPVAGIPPHYRDTNPVSKLTCGCCSYGASKPGCRPSVSLLMQKEWCAVVNVQNGFLRCSDKAEQGNVWPGSYSDSCIKCNTTQITDPSSNAKKPKLFMKLTCSCLDATNQYQPASSIVLRHGCEVVENVKGKLACHPAASRWHEDYRFQRTTDGAKVNPGLNDVVKQLNLGEEAATDTQEGEESWQAFLTHAREMPKTLFVGEHSDTKGIVILGGGTTYFISAWVDILMIRIQNCTLPIELWVDDTPEEALPPSVLTEMAELGVTVRVLDMLFPQDASAGFTHSKKFVLKPAAIVFSRFQQVIFLDADNIPVVNLNTLFDLPEFQETGAIFWPDFPALKAAAQVWKELPAAPFMGPQAESGQMVIDKARHWEPLMLALYFNVHADWYYPKISFGDKDTYQTAWYVLQHHFTMIHWPVASVGYGSGCSGNQDSTQSADKFRGHTMLQRGPSGQPMFLHKNLRKWSTANIETLPESLPEPGSEEAWKGRAWQTVSTCELNEGLSIEKWFPRTNTISSQLCNNLWFFERMSRTRDLDVSLLMRYQCQPTVKSVRVLEHAFIDYIGFDVEMSLLKAYEAVLVNPGYQDFALQTPIVRGYHTSVCKRCHLKKIPCKNCGPNNKLWKYSCVCQSPLDTQISEKLSLYEIDVPVFCEKGMMRYLNHTLVCQKLPLAQVWSGHVNFY